jgi:exopolysaccharide production protein ExoZ
MLQFHVFQGGGHLGVILFFLISGYVISLVGERETRAEFAIKRVLRIIPPLAVATTVFGVLNVLLSANGYGLIPGTVSNTLRDYILAAFLIDHFVFLNNSVMAVTWTLVSEFWFYALFLIILPLESHPLGSTLALLGMSAIISAPSLVSSYFAYHGQFNVYIPIFLIGRVFFMAHHQRLSPGQIAWLGMLCAMLFLMVHEARFPGKMFAGPIIKAFTYPTAMLIFCGLMSFLVVPVPKIVMFFGDISYSLYLLHLPVGMAVLIGVSPVLGYSVSLLLALLATVATSWVVLYITVEKPCQRLARTLAHRLNNVTRKDDAPAAASNERPETAEYDAKRTLNTTQAGQQYDESGQLVTVPR